MDVTDRDSSRTAAQIKKRMKDPATISALYQASMPFCRSNAAFLPKPILANN